MGIEIRRAESLLRLSTDDEPFLMESRPAEISRRTERPSSETRRFRERIQTSVGREHKLRKCGILSKKTTDSSEEFTAAGNETSSNELSRVPGFSASGKHPGVFGSSLVFRFRALTALSYRMVLLAGRLSLCSSTIS